MQPTKEMGAAKMFGKASHAFSVSYKTVLSHFSWIAPEANTTCVLIRLRKQPNPKSELFQQA